MHLILTLCGTVFQASSSDTYDLCALQAHILPEDVAKRINLKKRGKKNQPVMFFGMREVAYLPIKKVSRWSIGIIQATKQMEKDLAMNRTSESGSRAKLYQAVDEVCRLLSALLLQQLPYLHTLPME